MTDDNDLQDLFDMDADFDDDLVVDDPERLDRVVTEILDPVDHYEEGDGPEGPWYYRTLRVVRVMNAIDVFDVDGKLYKTIRVPDFSRPETTDDPHGALRDKLDEINQQSLDEL